MKTKNYSIEEKSRFPDLFTNSFKEFFCMILNPSILESSLKKSKIVNEKTQINDKTLERKSEKDESKPKSDDNKFIFLNPYKI